ncbi:hypothetical protein [Streptomyces sp. NPDC004042]|uniref:hypothetical protein n=1 Tax=Streptomyces sp. NPDC004042 TaxID=3154451 RepID=UPI0033A7C541
MSPAHLSPDARAVIRAADALTTQVRRIADAVSSGTCDASTLGAFDRHLGPCLLRADHDGPVHRGPEGETWATVVRVADDGATTPDDDRAVPPGGNAEDCSRCRPEIDKTVLYPWVCPGHPAADDTVRFLRRESLLVLLTRLQRGRPLSEEEAGTLRHHVETEIREANTARAVAAGNLRHVRTIVPELERAEAAIERVRAVARDWGPTLLPHSEAHRLLTDLTAALDGTEQPTTTKDN